MWVEELGDQILTQNLQQRAEQHEDSGEPMKGVQEGFNLKLRVSIAMWFEKVGVKP